MKRLWLQLLTVVVLVLGSGTLLAQLPTVVDPGPATTDRITTVGTEEASVRERAERSIHPPALNPPPQTDEYGYFNFNAYLTGLGATGGYVAIPNSFNENVDGSIEAWVYPTATTSSSPCIVAKGDSTYVGFALYWSASTSLLGMRFGSTPTANTGGTTVPLNQWTHVAVTWSGGAGNYTVTFYVNGAQSGSPVTNTGTWYVTADSMTIGSSRAPFAGKNFYGYIDEVRYWQDVRTAAEIATHRFAGLGDAPGANTGNALTSNTSYDNLNASYNFNTGGGTMFDFIGGYDGFTRNGAFTIYSAFAPQPIPYNFVLKCPFGANDFVEVPTNTAFNLDIAGTAEAWVYPTGQSTTHMILSRGTTGFQFFWGVRASIGNRIAVNIGSGTQFQNSDGTVIPLNQWSHVAIKWVQSGGNYTVTFYVNGTQSGTPVTNATTWTSTSGTLRIGGWHGGTNNHWNGRLDEVRLWNTARTEAQIRQAMFASGRGLLPNTSLVGIWNFDGNLKNFSAIAGIDGSFNTGGVDSCRLSAFANEASTGALSSGFEAQATVVNHGGSPNPFPQGFTVKAPMKKILDNATIRDTIAISSSVTLTAIEVFMGIRHTWCGDLNITLTAPNGQFRDLSSGNGGSGNDILTFFNDGGTALSTVGFYPPWTNFAAPEAAMGNFGGTTTQGNWILTVQDAAAGDTGWLAGWGIRLNNATGVGPIAGNVPDKFELLQNYPNPFNPATTIEFTIPKEANVNIGVYNILGQLVTTLVNDRRKAGAHSVQFDARGFTSGTYFYRITAGSYVETKKMLLLK